MIISHFFLVLSCWICILFSESIFSGWTRSTVKTILAINPDLEPGDPLQPGRPLCLFLCSAAGNMVGNAAT